MLCRNIAATLGAESQRSGMLQKHIQQLIADHSSRSSRSSCIVSLCRLVGLETLSAVPGTAKSKAFS